MPEFWARRTLALLLSPLGLLLVSATRLLIISDYNTTTATTIASSGGYVNTLLGTMIPLVPIFLPYLALLLLLFRRFVLSALAFAAAALISPTVLPPVTALHGLSGTWHGILSWAGSHEILVILIVLILVGVDINLLRAGVVGISFSVIAAAALATVLLFPYVAYVYPVPQTAGYWENLMRQPWLPAERMILKSGAPVIGYTLASDHDWTVVLSASSRTIKYIPTPDVLARRVCDITPDGSVTHPPSPLVPLLHAQAVELPSCSGRGSAGNFSSSLDMQVSRWATIKTTRSSRKFRAIPALSRIGICATAQVTATLSVELMGARAGFQVRVDRGPLMKPGPVRFDPVGQHDSFAFTFVQDMSPNGGSDRHTFDVEWRSPSRRTATLERATLNLQYQRGTNGC